MAANNQIVKKSIQIDASDTVRTVKSLKQEIADLRDELLNLEQGTEEYDEVQKQLQEDVSDLNEVMGAHKEKAEALEGSYNDLQNQLKELKAAWKATNDEAERDVLGQKISELNSKLSSMDQSIGDFHRNVGNYQSAWQGLTGVMENGEKVTDDLEKGIKAFGTAMGLSEKQVSALSDVLKRMKDGFKIAKDIAKAREETTKLGQAEAQAATQGTLLATSQKATGAAAKTMAAGEVAAGTATKTLSVAMRGLKAALISTGIGALVVLLGELVNMIDRAVKKSKSGAEAAAGNIRRAMALFEESNRVDRRKDEHDLDMMEARNEKERVILEKRLENAKEYAKKYEETVYQSALTHYNEYMAEFDKLSKRNQDKLLEDTSSVFYKEQELWQDANEGLTELREEAQDARWAIQVFDEKQKHLSDDVKENLKAWSDLVQDPKFQAAWHNLFELDLGGNSPVEALKAQREAAIALVNEFGGDTKEVEQYFNQTIQEAEDEWKSLVEKEQQIFDERLTPVQRLENEKAEWIEKAERWGMDATAIVKYYDDKITEELKKADDERKAQEEQANQERLEETEKYLAQVDAMLSTQEMLDELFNPRGVDYTGWKRNGTTRSEIDQDMEDIQRLYDAQLEYLNGLLESADLTEEAYAGVEERILSLTVTFNNQMNELKKEADYQGKNWALLSKKGVANVTLLENAFAGFSETAQVLGGENSEAFKGFATAQALMSSFLAANRVLAEEPGEMWIKIAAAAATLTAGLANVAAIWGVNSDGSNASSSMNASMSQAVPVIGNSQPINYTRNITSAEEEDAMNQPIYVTVTDIEDGINGHRAQVTNSSF